MRVPVFPNGCHVCEVEIDAETGALALVRYAAVDDVGRAINPLIVDGQTHGGAAQGIGQALFEQCVFDDDGQALSGSFMDYCVPRADDLPSFATAITERLGDRRWLELLRAHNVIVREQVAAHEGFEVKSEGDGFMLAFQSARRGIECGVDIQRAFAERNESAREPIRVRIGLHTGEAIKEADDFFGKNVILAARIAGQAQGGEILVSSLLKELTESGGDIAFGEGREVELKGLSGQHRVFEVEWREE